MRYCLRFLARKNTAKMLNYPAADRNKDPILEKLKLHVPQDKNLFFLEIASGSGQHVSHFAPNFPKVMFQPTDIDGRLLKSIDAHVRDKKLVNVLPAAFADVTHPWQNWPKMSQALSTGAVDIIYSANMIHISSNAAVDGIFACAADLLKPKSGILITYGPFALAFQQMYDLPANNKMLVFVRDP